MSTWSKKMKYTPGEKILDKSGNEYTIISQIHENLIYAKDKRNEVFAMFADGTVEKMIDIKI
jgi:hypothetical protein